MRFTSFVMGAAFLSSVSSLWAQPAGDDVVEPGLETVEAIYAKGHAAMRKWIDEGEPKEGADALPLIREAGEKVHEVSERGRNTGGPMLSFDALLDPAATAEAKEQARKAVAELEGAGVGELVAKIAVRPRMEIEIGPGQLVDMVLPQLGQFRGLARFTAARAAIAIERKDHAALLARVDEILALSRHASRQPSLLGSLVAIAVRAKADEVARRAVLTGELDDATLKALAARLADTSVASLDRALEAEEIVCEDCTEYVYFAGVKAGLAGVFEPGNADPVPPPPKTRVIADGVSPGPKVPDRKTQIRLERRYYAHLRSVAGMTEAARRAAPMPPELVDVKKDNLILGLLAPATEKMFAARAQSLADNAGVQTMIALERFRLANGAYPAGLGELVPRWLGALPVDPFTGKTLGYLAPKAGGYPGGRAYVLYAAARDCEDNGGNVNYEKPFDAMPESGKGLDFLLNREVR